MSVVDDKTTPKIKLGYEQLGILLLFIFITHEEQIKDY